MPARFLIYALIDPRTGEVRYVGKSTSGIDRPREHKSPSKLTQPSHRTNWIKSLLALDMVYEIRVLDEIADPEMLSDAERHWIAVGRAEGWPLTNLTDGGDGAGCPHTEEWKEKIGRSHRGKVVSDATREKQRLAHVGVPLSSTHRENIAASGIGREVSAETRAKIGEANRKKMLGRKASPEARAKMSAAHTGKIQSPETRAKISASKKKGRTWI